MQGRAQLNAVPAGKFRIIRRTTEPKNPEPKKISSLLLLFLSLIAVTRVRAAPTLLQHKGGQHAAAIKPKKVAFFLVDGY
jgi:hypothetical protein